jgi:hypothetical protein
VNAIDFALMRIETTAEPLQDGSGMNPWSLNVSGSPTGSQ